MENNEWAKQLVNVDEILKLLADLASKFNVAITDINKKIDTISKDISNIKKDINSNKENLIKNDNHLSLIETKIIDNENQLKELSKASKESASQTLERLDVIEEAMKPQIEETVEENK